MRPWLQLQARHFGRAIVAQYYPEYLPPEAAPEEPDTGNEQPGQAEVFDFRAEMHKTRVNAERLLSEGKIDEAETYMELRRRFLWDNGYHIRKLNQAYFAFYGAYADQPGGAAGEDPVGAAVRRCAIEAHHSLILSTGCRGCGNLSNCKKRWELGVLLNVALP